MRQREQGRALCLGVVVITLAAVLPRPSFGDPDFVGEAIVAEPQQVEVGRRLYRKGILPSGELISGTVQGDARLTGEQAICGACHRRSGLGSMEGQEVVPAVTGDILYKPLRLPTSKPPLAPIQRPAYTDETLKRAVREGIGADGQPLNAFMPRYPLSDEELEPLVSYLKTLRTDPDPGVSDHEIHLATIVADSVDPGIRKAVLDVFEAFIAQKNSESRHEGSRAANAPWNKKWIFGPYRKWVLHVWELKGGAASWPAQLQARYEKQPVFAVLSGVAPGNWQPVHAFCEHNEVPCLFPTTDLPVVDEQSTYSVYFSQGMTLEADTIARHFSDEGLLSRPIVQVYRESDQRGVTAAAQLRRQIDKRGGRVIDFRVSDAAVLTGDLWKIVSDANDGGTDVFWLERSDLAGLWSPGAGDHLKRFYLSTTLYGVDPAQIPSAIRDRVYLVHPSELPNRLSRLLARSTGWLKAKRIYAPPAQVAQANAFFALKIVGGAIEEMRGFFVRDYLLENIEHMVDNAFYTSVYPRMSLAPGQRFVSRGAYIVRFEPEGSRDLAKVTDWLVP